MKADLHTHSIFSDGLKSPEELCHLALKAGVTHISLTDHDTAGGTEEMRQAAQNCGLAFLPGAELSSASSGTTHILIYGNVEAASPLLQEAQNGRIRRAEQILEKLSLQGCEFSEETRRRLLADVNVGRPHIAQAMMDAGFVNTVKQAFDRWLGKGCPCYVGRNLKPALEVISSLKELPVIPVLAHPMETGLDETGVLALISAMIPCGLRGVEAFHPSATPAQGRMLENFARDNGLLVTGGSDYHALPGYRNHLGRTGHTWQKAEADVEALFAAALNAK